MEIRSPITETTNVCSVKSYIPSITSDSRLVRDKVDNYVCLDSGIIFNAAGPRGGEKDFYTDEYDLHSENSVSEFKYFESGKAKGIYDEILSFISRKVPLGPTGRVLDIGCGKGLFLRKFATEFPGWELFGVEPSKNAQSFFQETLPKAHVFEGIFEDSGFIGQKFDLVTANGVLEHVPHPVEFLKNIRKTVKQDGLVYIGVPNFENNPADLLTFDHLSRFTVDVISLIAGMAGFELVHVHALNTRVPVWFILKPINYSVPFAHDSARVEKSLRITKRSVLEIDAFFESYERAAESARKKNKKIAMYGSGAFGLIGTQYTGMTEDLVSIILDDNPSVWGSYRIGKKIENPQNLISYPDISDLVISANPCYVNLIANKIKENMVADKITLHRPTFLEVR